MQTLMRGTPIFIKSSAGNDIWALDISAGVETEPISVDETVVHSIFYKIGNAAQNLTIQIAKGFQKGNDTYWTDWENLEPTAVSGHTGDTNWHCLAFTLPYCSLIKFRLTGTSTSAYLVLMLGMQ